MTRRGFTLIEMLMVVTVIGVMLAVVAPRIGRGLVQQNARSARDAVVTLHAKARAVAVRRARPTSVVFNGNRIYIVSRRPVTGAVDTVGTIEDLNGRYNVTLTTTRDTLTFDSRGLGTETGSTTVTVTRAPYSYSVTINQWGRVLR